jgi:predicted nucleotidyltransferase
LDDGGLIGVGAARVPANLNARHQDRRRGPAALRAELLRRLAPAYQPERVYLFASRARGDAGPDSDYGLLLVVADDAPPERRRSRLAYEVLRGTGVAADVLVWTRQAFEVRPGVVTSLPATVMREGQVLLGA